MFPNAAGAATAFEELLADRLRVLGPDHPDTLTTRQGKYLIVSPSSGNYVIVDTLTPSPTA